MSTRAAVEASLARAHRQEWGAVLAATVRTVRDLDLAEECVQEAYTAALTAWVRDGIPANPAAWLTVTAKRRGIDTIRRDRTLRSKLPLLVEPDEPSPEGALAAEPPEQSAVADDVLRLVFLCCHPALAAEAQAALTLRLVCGVETPDIAAVFLVPVATMAARLTRAKKKIAGSVIPFRMPTAAELPDRLDGVLAVVHLLFTTGHSAPSGPDLLRSDLADTALRLARALHALLPAEPEVGGLLALVLATDARRATRVDGQGRLIRLADQDRALWDRRAIAEARRLALDALTHPRAGRYTLQAAIACQHAAAPTAAATDWPQILGLYDALLSCWPTPVVALNRAVALAEVAGPAAALGEVETLARTGRLAGYPYLPAVHADLLCRLGRTTDALDAYRRALELTDNHAERRFLHDRIIALVQPSPPTPNHSRKDDPCSI